MNTILLTSDISTNNEYVFIGLTIAEANILKLTHDMFKGVCTYYNENDSIIIYLTNIFKQYFTNEHNDNINSMFVTFCNDIRKNDYKLTIDKNNQMNDYNVHMRIIR